MPIIQYRPRVHGSFNVPLTTAGKKPAGVLQTRCEENCEVQGFNLLSIMAAVLTVFPHQATAETRPHRYERPASAKLSGLKFELYHPRLPTLRRMDMDTVCHKLPIEHSRTTTTCTRGTVY